ncbi:PQQ-binding-like beta-propeller repeat protein [Dactylosporangium sp. CS-047395]|uniref:outer membrane protein assembly factor BamB family protein n=1 Tax=Dactylosporangium sp. CS-047395 TaxID=3239936 RepID=UPI003D8E0C71
MSPRGVPRRPDRPWRRFVLLLAVLLGLAGGAPGTSLDPAVVLRGAGLSEVGGDGSAISVLSTDSLASYRMPGGARRWSVRLAAGAQLLAADGTRVVLGFDDGTNRAAAVLTGLDAATGAPAWRRTGYVPAVYGCACGDGVVVAEQYVPGGDQPATTALAGIDVRTGAVRWSLGTPPGGRREVVREPGEPVRIAMLDAGGTLRLYRADTAALVSAVDLQDPGPVEGLAISADRLLVYRYGLRNIVAGTVFDLGTGRRLWQRTAEPYGERLWWCARALCARANEGPILVLDPDTGRERWRLDGWTDLSAVTERYLLATPSPPDGRHLVLDAATGRVVRRIDGWEPAGDPAGTRLLVAGRGAAGTTLVARLDVESGAVTALGQAGRWSGPPECFTTGALLLCRLDQGRIPVWRLPAA